MLGVNNGQRLAVEAAISLGELANACGVSRPTAQRWKRGESVPREVHRISIQTAFGIGVEDWDAPLPADFEITVPPPKRTGRPKKTAKRQSKKLKPTPPPSSYKILPYPEAPDADAPIVENLRYSLACIRHDLEHRNPTTAARSKLRSDEARTLGLIAKLQREEELSEDRYVKQHPAFKAHCKRIVEAVKPCPDCARKVSDALRVN